MIAMRPIKLVGLTNAHIHGKWLTVVLLIRIVRPTMNPNELFQKRIRTRRVVRRVGHAQNRLIRPLRKPRRLAKLRGLQLLGQQRQVVLPPRLVAREGLSQALHGPGVLLLARKSQIALIAHSTTTRTLLAFLPLVSPAT